MVGFVQYLAAGLFISLSSDANFSGHIAQRSRKWGSHKGPERNCSATYIPQTQIFIASMFSFQFWIFSNLHYLDGNMFLLAQAYTSILYLKKFDNFRIILRGKAVEQICITDELKFKKVVTYKPQAAHDSQVVINIFCNSNPCYLVSYLYHFSPTSNCARQFGCMSGSKVRKQSLSSSFSFFFWP